VTKTGEDAWLTSIKEFVIAIDYGHTEPGALELLNSLENSTVFICNHHLLDKGHLRPTAAYHPKLYSFHYEDEVRVITGSANLTKAALHRNTEIVHSQIMINTSLDFESLWLGAKVGAVVLTTDLLDRYKELRRLAKSAVVPRAEPIEPIDALVTVLSAPNIDDDREYAPLSTENEPVENSSPEQPWLWGEINAENSPFDPMTFEHFWVNAGSMSSSASNNQLELGRGSNLFFGYNYRNFENADGIISLGPIRLKIKDVLYEDINRVYKWHPNNMMERVNLPTYRMAGVDYQNKCLLFKRRLDYFELIIADWDSEEALSWRAASVLKNALFRIPATIRRNQDTRSCGFF